MSTYQPAEWEAKFLEVLRGTCNVSLASYAAGIARKTAYARKKQYKKFADAWNEAKLEAVERLEAEAWQRARATSDTLMIFLLKANKPKKYRESIKITLDYNMTPDKINTILRLLAEAGDASPGDTLEALAQSYVATPADTSSSGEG